MATTYAAVTTENPSLNMKKLCRHFGHKVEATFDDERGEIHFPFGTATLTAEEGVLVMQGRADSDEDIARFEQVMADHLVRFASKESLTVEWQREV
ncbi:DUF2218 domain-containing protein [Halomonas shantousis]